MRFRWGWLEPVMPVPYVPTLGPVRREDPIPDLFEAVVETAGTGRFLPYDKDRRWADRKTERVLVEDIEHDQERTLVPTLVERGAVTVKVHAYGGDPAEAADVARRLAEQHGAGAARVVSFLAPQEPEARAVGATRVQLKEFAGGPGQAPGVPVLGCKQLPEEASFAVFAEAMAGDGFAFLHERMRAGAVGPVLTVLHGGRVAGAIGPMETLSDAGGAVRLLPQYFGVLPQYRGFGYGRALWRAAMHWGHQHSADYQLLQTAVGGASDRLCAAEGLASLGFVQQTGA
ncbi:GNAT family N-acetyltransferase [Streptomyces sp. GC420]|uniref:GNAT family N-acetyltransferase n=1 Tax=Streptomyces sp. GC420 TaxID=2697568 RepID=UPI001415206C|nr:GNAT family N-acetyltransferase [Streptomyces sp. GC420]NBM15777.1 GNAT family N-acetyltransferase [Streptomyces sp. GC420]